MASSIQSIGGKEIPVYNTDYDNAQMDQGDFLKVLLASFAYQDPFETQDIAKFIDNTVKLRELEVMKGFEDAISMFNSNNTLFLNAANMIGQKVLYEGDRTLVENGLSRVAFNVDGPADVVELYLYDGDGKVVDKKVFTDIEPGTKNFYTFSDNGLQDGYYKVGIIAKKGEESLKSYLYATAKIEGVEKEGNDIVFLYDGGKLSLDSIQSIGG